MIKIWIDLVERKCLAVCCQLLVQNQVVIHISHQVSVYALPFMSATIKCKMYCRAVY